MNKTMKKLNITIIIGILAVWVSGSLFHFVYDWTGRNTFAGLFFMPWGLILGPFVGAFVGEIIGKSNVRGALKSGLGSLTGFLCGTFFKVAVALVITGYVLATIF